MKTISTLAPLLVLMFACKLCSVTGGSSRFDPYRGSLADLVPKNTTMAGSKLEQKSLVFASASQLANGSQAFRNASSSIQVEYEYTVVGLIVPISVRLVNYDSKYSADAAMRALAQQDHAVLQPKTKNGQTVGQRYSANNGRTIIWSNGSLICQVSASMAKPAENFEEAMSF